MVLLLSMNLKATAVNRCVRYDDYGWKLFAVVDIRCVEKFRTVVNGNFETEDFFFSPLIK